MENDLGARGPENRDRFIRRKMTVCNFRGASRARVSYADELHHTAAKPSVSPGTWRVRLGSPEECLFMGRDVRIFAPPLGETRVRARSEDALRKRSLPEILDEDVISRTITRCASFGWVERRKPGRPGPDRCPRETCYYRSRVLLGRDWRPVAFVWPVCIVAARNFNNSQIT